MEESAISNMASIIGYGQCKVTTIPHPLSTARNSKVFGKGFGDSLLNLACQTRMLPFTGLKTAKPPASERTSLILIRFELANWNSFGQPTTTPGDSGKAKRGSKYLYVVRVAPSRHSHTKTSRSPRMSSRTLIHGTALFYSEFRIPNSEDAMVANIVFM